MEEAYKFQYVITQGRSDDVMWVESFQIFYSDNVTAFTLYRNHNLTSVSTQMSSLTPSAS